MTALGITVAVAGIGFVVLAVIVRFGAVSTDARQAPVLDLPATPRVLIIGDSYTAGSGASEPAVDNWAVRAAEELDWDVVLDAVPGSGYTKAGVPSPSAAPFGERLATHAGVRFDLIVFQGSQNDATSEPGVVSAAVVDALGDARTWWPDAAVLAMGPSAPLPAGLDYVDVSRTIGLAVRASGATYIDVVERRWFTAANSADFTAADGRHLDAAGYAFLADRFVGVVRQCESDRGRTGHPA